MDDDVLLWVGAAMLTAVLTGGLVNFAMRPERALRYRRSASAWVAALALVGFGLILGGDLAGRDWVAAGRVAVPMVLLALIVVVVQRAKGDNVPAGSTTQGTPD